MKKLTCLTIFVIFFVVGISFADNYTDWQKELSMATPTELFTLVNLVGEEKFAKEEPDYLIIRDTLATELEHRIAVVDLETKAGQLTSAALAKITAIKVCDSLAVVVKNLDDSIQVLRK